MLPFASARPFCCGAARAFGQEDKNFNLTVTKGTTLRRLVTLATKKS